MDKKNLIIAILAIALLALGGWTYYTLTKVAPAKAIAACEAKVKGEIIPAVTAQATAACTEKVGGVLMQLKQAPDCSAALDQILAASAAK